MLLEILFPDINTVKWWRSDLSCLALLEKTSHSAHHVTRVWFGQITARGHSDRVWFIVYENQEMIQTLYYRRYGVPAAQDCLYIVLTIVETEIQRWLLVEHKLRIFVQTVMRANPCQMLNNPILHLCLSRQRGLISSNTSTGPGFGFGRCTSMWLLYSSLCQCRHGTGNFCLCSVRLHHVNTLG